MLGLRNPTEKQREGKEGEDVALAYLLHQGMTLVERNFRCRSGEIDLIMRHQDTLVFVEVRKRRNRNYGGAVSSITKIKKERLIQTANLFLMRFRKPPACRFDVIVFDGDNIEWLQNAIEEM